jgi:hypothetical protein
MCGVEEFEVTVTGNSQDEGSVTIMSNEQITITVDPSKTFPTVIPGTKVRVTFEFNPQLGHAESHTL